MKEGYIPKEQRKKILFLCDDIRFTSGISTMAKECRKFGIALILASQEAKDFNSSLFSAIANYLVLRVTEADAKALVRNVSSADQEKSLIDKIKGLEKFKAMFFCEGRPKPTILKLNNV